MLEPPKPVGRPCQAEGLPSTRRGGSKHGWAVVVVPWPAGNSTLSTGRLGSALAPAEQSVSTTATIAAAAPAAPARSPAPPAVMPRTSGGQYTPAPGS